MSYKIKKVQAREILDSRGNPTLEVKVEIQNGILATASVPAGASRGRFEAYELRDGDKTRFNGMGVLKAQKNVNTKIAKALQGKDARAQQKIDQILIKLDGTKNKSRLGANALLGVSLASSRAAAQALKVPLYKYISKTYNLKSQVQNLPVPMFNIFNGGKHADTNLDFQEFMIIPRARGQSFKEMVRSATEVFHELKSVLRERGLDTDVGAEGGYAPDISSSIQAVEMILAAIIRKGFKLGRDFNLGIDVGSSVLYDKRKHKYIFKLDQATYTNSTLVGLYLEWWRRYPIILLEDGLAENDWTGWQELTQELKKELILVGDDLFATNLERLQKGIKKGVANAILVKPNQVGTLTETVECAKLAQRNNYKVIVSHRSGETCDTFISDLAVALGADYLKAGAPSRGERVAKYNRLMEIEENEF